MASANNGIISPQALLNSPLQLVNGIITSPVWIAFFTRFAFPLLFSVSDGQNSISDLLQFGDKAAAADLSSELALTMGAGASRAPELPVFPPSIPAANAIPDLAMMAAVQRSKQEIPWILADMHANRSKYSNSSYQVGALFIETDRRVFYRNTGTAWVFVGGTQIDVFANRPAALGSDDTGYEFYATDKKLLYYWDGAAWQVLGPPPLASAEIWIGDASGVAQNRAMSGDATLSNLGALALATTGVGAGVYGDNTHVAVFIVDAKGRLTFANSAAISFSDIADGTYTVGVGPTTDGTLTFVDGRITAIQEAT